MRFRYPRSGNNRLSFSARFWQALQGLIPTAVVTRLMASPRPRTDVGGPVDPAEPEAPSRGPTLWRLVFKMNTFV